MPSEVKTGQEKKVNPSSSRPSPLRVGLAFATVYLVWGSTYLGIRFAIETIPPFLMAAARFLLAGGLLYAWTHRQAETAPTIRQWRNAGIAGVLLFVGGNGMVTWAEQSVTSGSAALFIATVPLWMLLLDWGVFRGPRPTALAIVGLVLGSMGVGLLVGNKRTDGSASTWQGAAALMVSCACWSVGSLFSRGAGLPKATLVSVAMQMLLGGAGLLVAATVMGEWARLDISGISGRSLTSLLYLILFGSILAFSAYAWLLKVCTALQVATYAYVNPVVAVFVGCVLGGEPFERRTLASTALIALAVLLVTLSRRSATPPRPAPPEIRAPVPGALRQVKTP
jgi:drug/metabolite transporter (DMT)-like permease